MLWRTGSSGEADCCAIACGGPRRSTGPDLVFPWSGLFGVIFRMPIRWDNRRHRLSATCPSPRRAIGWRDRGFPANPRVGRRRLMPPSIAAQQGDSLDRAIGVGRCRFHPVFKAGQRVAGSRHFARGPRGAAIHVGLDFVASRGPAHAPQPDSQSGGHPRNVCVHQQRKTERLLVAALPRHGLNRRSVAAPV